MSIVRFGVNKPVPVNLLMIAILLAGSVAGLSLRREFFPQIDPEQAMITLPYPGASPGEIEQAMALKVEDKLADLDDIKEMQTTLTEGGGGILVKFREGCDLDDAMDDVERAIDSLLDLPDGSETIQAQLFEPRLPVIRVTVFGDMDEEVMKRAILGVRDDLRSMPNMGEVLVGGVRNYELRVDVHHEALTQHQISLPQIADAIGQWMADVPGGTVRNKSGNIKIRTMGVAERAAAVGQIVVRADVQGRAIRVSDIAKVSDSFVDEQVYNRYDAKPAAVLTVFGVGNQDIVNMAQMVRAYVDGRNGKEFSGGLLDKLRGSERKDAWRLGMNSAYPLPPGAGAGVGAGIVTTTDLARFVEGRLGLLLRNACYGGILVFGTLLLFLNWRVAVWVGMGLIISLMGTLMLMAWADITLNLLTMFGLIVVMGLLVDDAIVVSENIQTRHDGGEPALVAAISGTEQVLWPVVATVLTSIVAFLPLTFVRGHIGSMLGALPMVVACALAMSLVESLLILPSHMGHSLAKRARSRPGRWTELIRRGEKWRDHLVLDRLVPLYGRMLGFLLRNRYVSIAAAITILMITLGMVRGGYVEFTFMPTSDSESILIDVRMPVGTPIGQTDRIVSLIEQAAQDQPETKNVSALLGRRANIDTGVNEMFAPHVGQLYVELHYVEERERESSEVIDSIRQALEGKLGDIDRIAYTAVTGGPGGPSISIRVRGKDLAQIDLAVVQLKAMLGKFEGLYDIADDSDPGQSELQIRVKPEGAALGFTNANVNAQVRGALFGIDAHVYAEHQEDIDVRLRLDERVRHSQYALENLWLISQAGNPVPLGEVADITRGQSYATIKRVDQQRAITVTAATAGDVNPERIVDQLTAAPLQGLSPIDQVRQAFPRLDIKFTGRQEELGDAFDSLPLGFLAAMVMIYVILAWLFSSYVQPIIVLLAVPFAMIGVVWGHLLLGYDLTFLSLIGFVALSGIVVNDSLILVQFYNHERSGGKTVYDALVAAGRTRLRAILLTTITTVLGLTPLILERSFQAKFLIPMAISIAMGLISATVLVLIVLPCFILVFDDLKRVGGNLWNGRLSS